MKNMYVLAILVLLLFTGCSNDDYSGKDLAGTLAQIQGTINEAATRATETSWTDGDCIGVTVTSGNNINIKYQQSGTGGTFTVVNGEGEDNAIYLKGSTGVTLTAYYPYTGENGTDPGIIAVNTGNEKQTATAQPTIDFLFATAQGSRTEPNVNFRFDHKMSKLVFVFKADESVTLSDIQYTLDGLSLDGTFDTNTGNTLTGASTADLTVNVATPGSGNMVSSLILLPQDVNTLPLELEMAGKYYTSSIEDLFMAAGYEYTYNVTIHAASGTEIPKLTITQSTINPWTPGTGGDIDANPIQPGTDVSSPDPSEWGDSGKGGNIDSENV